MILYTENDDFEMSHFSPCTDLVRKVAAIHKNRLTVQTLTKRS